MVSPAAMAARGNLGVDAFESGHYRRPMDLSAYAPTADAIAHSHRLEGRLHLSGTPATRTLVADEDYLAADAIGAASTLPETPLDPTQTGTAGLPPARTPLASTQPTRQGLHAP